MAKRRLTLSEIRRQLAALERRALKGGKMRVAKRKRATPRKRARRRTHKNPARPLYGARSRKAHGAAHLIGVEVYEIRYRHATDGKDYKHPFESGVLMLGMADGSIKIESSTGLRLWEEINV